MNGMYFVFAILILVWSKEADSCLLQSWPQCLFYLLLESITHVGCALLIAALSYTDRCEMNVDWLISSLNFLAWHDTFAVDLNVNATAIIKCTETKERILIYIESVVVRALVVCYQGMRGVNVTARSQEARHSHFTTYHSCLLSTFTCYTWGLELLQMHCIAGNLARFKVSDYCHLANFANFTLWNLLC